MRNDGGPFSFQTHMVHGRTPEKDDGNVLLAYTHIKTLHERK
jgi:hypothetical protein